MLIKLLSKFSTKIWHSLPIISSLLPCIETQKLTVNLTFLSCQNWLFCTLKTCVILKIPFVTTHIKCFISWIFLCLFYFSLSLFKSFLLFLLTCFNGSKNESMFLWLIIRFKNKNSLKPRASLCAIIYEVSPGDDKVTTRTAEQARG